MVDLTDHELTRRHLWTQVAANSEYYGRYNLAVKAAEYADALLAEFDARFKEPSLPKPKKVTKKEPIKAGRCGGTPGTTF